MIDLFYAAPYFPGFSGTAKVRLDILNHVGELASIQTFARSGQ